jgi:hypothetical protein
LWFAVFWTLAPIVAAGTSIVLWLYGNITAQLAGVIVQAMTISPLALTFRQRLATLAHDVTDWTHGAGSGKETTRWYRFFLTIRGPHVTSVRERALISILEFVGLVALVLYFVGGLILQNL